MMAWLGDRRPLLWLCSCLFVLGAAVRTNAAGEYRTVEVESLKITIDSEWGSRTGPGYVPVRFDITNLGEARVIEIIGQGTRFSRLGRGAQPGGTAVRQAVRMARGDRVRLTIPVPVFADNENVRFEIRESGRTLERFSFSGFQSGLAPTSVGALIVADPASEFGKVTASWPRMIKGPGTRAPAPARMDFVLDPSRLPSNWLGFTSLRAVFIGPGEWGQLGDDQKAALLTWTAAGGDLFFVDGDVNALVGPAQRAVTADDRPVRAYFFGRVHPLASESVAPGGLATVVAAADKLQDDNWALPANRARDWGIIVARGFRLPIPGIDGVPARAYLTILILFSLLIGPVNYWFLWRRGRQVLLVLTAPVISAVFIVLLAGYVIAGEGLGVHGRAVTFTMLDQARAQASMRASVSLYAAGMTPAGGLRFARDIAVFPIGRDGTGGRERQVLDLTDAQSFSAGVIEARSPTNFEQIGVRPARERLTFSREAGGMGVVNGLGVTVTTLVYRAGGTAYTLTDRLPPGGRAIMTTDPVAADAVVPQDMPLSARFVHLFGNQPEGSYLAVVDRSPFWDPGVSGVMERGSFHLVIGWPGGQP